MDVGAISTARLRDGTDTAGMTTSEAAQEFEAMVVAELLKAAREAGEAWGDEDKETGSEAYLEFAEQHLSRILAGQGLFGFKQMALQDFARAGAAGGGEAKDSRGDSR